VAVVAVVFIQELLEQAETVEVEMAVRVLLMLQGRQTRVVVVAVDIRGELAAQE
jgi:hypothetical protein